MTSYDIFFLSPILSFNDLQSYSCHFKASIKKVGQIWKISLRNQLSSANRTWLQTSSGNLHEYNVERPSEPHHDKTNKMTVCPAKTQISLGMPSLTESSLCAQWVAKDPIFLHADSEDSDQTGQMPSLIRVFAGRTCHFFGFVMQWLK